jgi:ferredoxin-like protein FixX
MCNSLHPSHTTTEENGHPLNTGLSNLCPAHTLEINNHDHLQVLNSLICFCYEKNGISRDPVAARFLCVWLIASSRFKVYPSNCYLDNTTCVIIVRYNDALSCSQAEMAFSVWSSSLQFQRSPNVPTFLDTE